MLRQEIIDANASWEKLQLAGTDLTCLRKAAADAAAGRAGVFVVFLGGTGMARKLAAGALAREARLDLYRVDLAGVTSKYIGETEKNLDAVLSRAATRRSVLLFDEADALFGRRTDVRDSHDRYANIEVNYLLERIEKHPGIVGLAVNRKSASAETLRRRARCTIELRS